MSSVWIVLLPPLFVLINLVMLEIGHRYALAYRPCSDESAIGPTTSTVLSLMGLVLAFSFSNASTRLDHSRETILDEVNALETMWLRVDLADPQTQPRLRQTLRRYVDARIRAYKVFPEPDEYQREVQLGRALLAETWTLSVKTSVPTDRLLLLWGVNDVGDTAGARTLSLGTHLPPLVFAFLFGIVLIGSTLIGAAMATQADRLWFYRIIISLVLSGTVFTIMDMEFPRRGFQLLHRADAMLVDLRRSME